MQVIRSSVLSFSADPGFDGNQESYEYIEDGAVLINDHGTIEQVAPWTEVVDQFGSQVQLHDLRGSLLLPGFIDSHVHSAQLEVIASHGTQLLDWLDRHTFPAEARFVDIEHATKQAELFVSDLIRNGVTTAAVWPTVHAHSVDAVFTAASARHMRLISGKVLMDQNCPTNLQDQMVDAVERTLRDQIERWHGYGRLAYAITPRFVPATSAPLLKLGGQLLSEFDGLFAQNHVAENLDEVAWVKRLFPEDPSYLSVYARFGYCRPRSLFAHSIWLNDNDWQQLSASGSAIAFCPSSNLFLGSGFFDLKRANEFSIPVGLASDVGGGYSLSPLKTMAAAYLIQQQRGVALDPFQALYLHTLGAAKAMTWDDRIGRVAPGYEADLVCLDWARGVLPTQKDERTRHNLHDRLFSMLFMADDRNVRAVWINGQRQPLV